jgi:hypothetical protein
MSMGLPMPLTETDLAYKMFDDLRKRNRELMSRGGIAVYMNVIFSFVIILVLVLSRGSRPRLIGA